jgi:hypothetical protein
MNKSDIKENAKSLASIISGLHADATPKDMFVVKAPPSKIFQQKDRRIAGNGSPLMRWCGLMDGRNHYIMDRAECLAWFDRRWPYWRENGFDNDGMLEKCAEVPA